MKLRRQGKKNPGFIFCSGEGSVHTSSSNSITSKSCAPCLWMRDVPNCMRSRDCFLPMSMVSTACQPGRGDICGAAVRVQINIGLQVVPMDMLLSKKCWASSKTIWHLGITLVDMMGYIVSPVRVAEPFGGAAPLSWSEAPKTGTIPLGWQ